MYGQTCETCKFWLRIVNLSTVTGGECRRYPIPQPETSPAYWCGEWFPRPKPAEPVLPTFNE